MGVNGHGRKRDESGVRQVVCERLRRYCADAVLRTATTEGDWKAREKCVDHSGAAADSLQRPSQLMRRSGYK